MKNKLKLFACFGAGLLASIMAAHAQVGVTATLPGTALTNVAPALATSSSFDMNGGNAVALLVTSENAVSTPNISATFAGQPMTLGVWTNQTLQWAGIFYLINPATTVGAFELTGDQSSIGLGYSAIALGNVGGVADSDALANTVNVGQFDLLNTTLTNGGFVLGAAVNNGFSSSRPQPQYVSGPADQVLLDFLFTSSSVPPGSSGHLHNYGDLPTAGTYTNTYANVNGSGARNAYVTLAFETAELLTPISWAVGNGTWDINTTANWSNGVGLVVYKEIGGVGNEVIFNDTASGASPITVTLNTSVLPASVAASNSTKNYTISGSGSIDGGAALTKTGSGTLTLGTANTFSGDVNLNGGTTVFSALDNLGSGSSINFGGGTLRYNGNADDISARTVTIAAGGATIDTAGQTVTFFSSIGNSGAGGLTKTGLGTLNLGGIANNYFGDTVVSQGTLGIGSAFLPNSSNIIVAAGAELDASGYILRTSAAQTLSGVGVVNGSLSVPVGTRISPATSSTVGTLTFTNFGTLDISGTLLFNVTTSGSDLIVADYVNVNLGAELIVPSPALTNGSYKLIQANQGFFGLATYFTFSLGQPGKSGDLVIVNDGGTTNSLYLVVADLASDDLTWNGTDFSWDQSGSDWYLTGTATPWVFTNGSTVRFDEVGAANPSVLLDGLLKPSLVVVSNPVTDYSFSEFSGGSKISGAGGLLKQGAGSLTISTVNDNTGPTTIQGGVVSVFGSLGSGAITNNAELIFAQSSADSVASISGTGALTQQGSSTLTVAGAANYTGPTAINSGTLIVGSGGAAGAMSTSAITNNGTLRLNSSTDWNYSMPDTGTGNLRKEGTNLLTMNGVNTRTGETRVDGGKVILGGANYLKGSVRLEGSGTVDMNGADQLMLNLTGGGGVVVNNAGTATNLLTVSNAVATTAFADVLDNEGSGGAVAILKTGSEEMYWRGNNTYSGGTEIREGRIRANTSDLFGTGPVNLTGGGISFTGGSMPNTINLLPVVGSATNFLFNSGNITFVAPVAGSTDLLVILGAGATSSLTFRQAGGATQWAGMTGTVYVRSEDPTKGGFFRSQTGTDMSTVTVNLDDSQATINSDGTRDIRLGALVGNTNSARLSASGSSTFHIGAKNLSTTFAGELAASANNLVKVGSGTLTLAGTNSFSGGMTVSNGTLALTLDAAPTNMNSVRVVSGATLNVTGIGGLSLGSAVAQTLNGAGTINGAVTSAGTAVATINPGGGIGNLTINGSLTLAGNSVVNMELNRTNSPATNDMITAAAFTGNGTLNVTNLGTDLVTGDKFKLFSSAISGFTTVNLPVSNALNTIAYVWTNKLAIDGSIELLSGASTVNPNPTNITFTASGGNLNLSWPASHLGWILQSQTNSPSVGLSTNWVDIAGSASVTSTNFPINPADPTVFYRLRLP